MMSLVVDDEKYGEWLCVFSAIIFGKTKNLRESLLAPG